MGTFRPTRLLALVGFVSISGCGSGKPPAAPQPTNRIESTERSPETVRNLEPERDQAQAAGCSAPCAKLIEEAERRQDQAAATKNEADVYSGFAARAGEAFVKAWRGCLLEVPHGPDLVCNGGRDVVANMVRAFAPSDEDDGIIFSNLVALDPRWNVDAGSASDTARAALRPPADRAEKAAAQDVKAERLEAAAYARLALDEVVRAEKDAVSYRQKFPKNKTEALLLSAAIGRYHDDRSDFAAALAALGQPPGPKDDPRALVVWHAEHGRALAGSKRTDQARAELDLVIASWPTDRQSAARLAGPMGPRPMPDREGVVDGVASALFFRAEQKRAAADALSPPRFTGAGTAAVFSQFVTTRIAEWAGKKQLLVQDAVASYKQIASTQPAPSRQWLTLATARTGQLFASYADQFKAIAVPAAVANDAQARAAYDKAVQASLAPVIDAARSAFTTCAQRAKRFRIDTSDIRTCSMWLEQNAP
jgi:hypothetical protein